MEQVMYSVCVKPAARSRLCTHGAIWVKDKTHEFYVDEKERGEWATKREAQDQITEPYEIVVEVDVANAAIAKATGGAA